ncbi:MAG TPA: MgtC/SapB family protein [Acidimicrobiales bacterium]|nr:MgtC/SapB family protein [Acidimicrobiales bacterium]
MIPVALGAEGARFGEASAGWADQLEIVGLIALATALGAVIGIERELANKSAGLRTHALVAAGAATAVAVGEVLLVTAAADGSVSGDPVRALHAVLTGIGFLGAGAIIRHRGEASVEGLTTAASLWLAAAVGIATGLGLWVVALGATTVAVVVLGVVHRIDFWIRDQAHPARNDEPS